MPDGRVSHDPGFNSQEFANTYGQKAAQVFALVFCHLIANSPTTPEGFKSLQEAESFLLGLGINPHEVWKSRLNATTTIDASTK